MTLNPINVQSLGTPHTDLCDRVAKAPLGEALPLIHVTSMGAGRNILFSGQLQTQKCKVFDRKLLYFFLGKPAYRLNNENEPSRQISRYPCVFVVEPLRVDPVQVYPFDTGAARAGYYKEADPYLAIQDYALESSYKGSLQQLSFGFDSVEDYFEGRLRSDLTDSVPEYDQATLSYALIANQANRLSNNPDTYDDRASAIELATDKHMDLKGAIRLMILPKQFLEGPAGQSNAHLTTRMKELQIESDLYDWQSTRSPADFRAEINSKVLSYVKRCGSNK